MSPRERRVSEIEAGAGVPSGNSAGTSTALCRAKTPGPGSHAAVASEPERKRCSERSRWVERGTSRW